MITDVVVLFIMDKIQRLYRYCLNLSYKKGSIIIRDRSLICLYPCEDIEYRFNVVKRETCCAWECTS